MKKKLGVYLIAGLLVFSMAFVTTGCPAPAAVDPAAEEEPEVSVLDPANPIVLRLGYQDRGIWPAEGSVVPDPDHAMALLFEAIVEAESGGGIQVERHSDGVLGSAPEMTELVQAGALDLTIVTGGIEPFFPPFAVINIPFLFRSQEIAWWVFDHSSFWRDFANRIEEEANLLLLGMGQNGFRNFTNNVQPIKTAADMRGLKMRVMEAPVYINMMNSLGAEPVPIAWPELYTSLQTGVVDGQENPVSIIIRGTLYEVQEYVTLSGHVWSENSLLMNPQKFHGLPAEAQAIIRAAARQAVEADRVAESLMTMVIGMDYIEGEGGMEVHRLTPAAHREFREITQPAVLEWLREEIGAGEVVDSMLAAVEEAEEALGYR